jgi:hypothetical protein
MTELEKLKARRDAAFTASLDATTLDAAYVATLVAAFDAVGDARTARIAYNAALAAQTKEQDA